MSATHRTDHPVVKDVDHLGGLPRVEPILLALSPAFVLAVAAIIANFLNMDLADVVAQLAAVGSLIAGGVGAMYARDRVISVDTYDEQVAVERREAEAAKAQEINRYLEDDLRKNTDAWEDMLQANEPLPGEEELDPRGVLPSLSAFEG